MRIDYSPPVFSGAAQPVEVKAENRAVIQAVHALNAGGSLGDSRELVFSLDRQTHRPVIRLVDRITGEVLQQFPNEQILRMAQDLKIVGR
jgi:uncharacterized FlaG/YvyC family protein